MNGSVERKSLHAFNLIGFEAIRITIWPKRTKIAPIFFWGGGGGRGGEIEHYAVSVTDAKPCFMVRNVFAKIPKVLKLFQKKYG